MSTAEHYWRARKTEKQPLCQNSPLSGWHCRATTGPPQTHQCVCVYCGTYPLPGTTHDPWHLPGKCTGQYPHCPRDQGKRARCLVQTHDGRLAPVTVPSAWAGHRRERGSQPGTGHRQLVKLAQGAHSILSHAIVAFRQGDFLAEALGPASVVVSGSPRFPKLQMSLEFSRLSLSYVLPWLLMEGRTEGSTRLLYYRALIEGQSQQNFTANCRLYTPIHPDSQRDWQQIWSRVRGLSEKTGSIKLIWCRGIKRHTSCSEVWEVSKKITLSTSNTFIL